MLASQFTCDIDRMASKLSVYSKVLRGHSAEDRLTYLAFSALKNSTRKVLLEFLHGLDIPASKGDAEECRFRFWRRLGKRELDCVLEMKGTLVLVEAKLDSPIDLNQLRDEYFEGARQNENFYLLLITADFSTPDEVSRLTSTSGIDPNRVRWLGWASMFTVFQGAREGGIDPVSERVLGDVMRILRDAGLRSFQGLGNDELQEWNTGADRFETIFREVQIFIKELNRNLKRRGMRLQRTRPQGRLVYRDGTSSTLNASRWVTKYLSFAFGPDEWFEDDFNLENDHYLFVRFDVRTTPRYWIGYRLNNGKDRHKAAVGRLTEVHKEVPDLVLCLNWDPVPWSEDTSIPETEAWVEIATELDLDAFPGPDLLEVTENWLIRLRDLVERLQLLPDSSK